MRPTFKFISCFAFLLSCSVAAVAEPELKQGASSEVPRAEVLLAKMSAAIKSSSYAGKFTYEHGSQLESYRISHQVVDGRERAFLQRLTGADTRIVREGEPGCGTIGRHLLAGARLSSSDGAQYGLERFYKSSVLGKDRIAGREAWLIQLMPRDEYRFGLVLAIDSLSHLLLRHVIFDPRKRVALERMQFVSLELGEDSLVTDGAVDVSAERCISDTYSPAGHSPWKPTWLPPGFILTGYEFHDDDGHMETYTDGIASFSIFVKSVDEAIVEEGRIQQGVSSRGASMALITAIAKPGETQHVSVVGEIPLSAAQKVSLSVRQVSQSSATDS